MTELVVAVKLKADGSGLVGQAREASNAVDGIGAAAKGAATGAAALTSATTATGAAARGLASGAAEADRSLDGMAEAARIAAGAQRQAAAAVGQLEGTVDRNNRALRTGADDLDRHAFGARNLGQQFGDLGLSIAGGISPARAFGQQAGQIGYALSEMGGTAGKVGAFLTGPWGIAFTIAAAVAAPFVETLFEAEKAADAAKVGADGLSEAQGVLGGLFDLTSGKIKSQNELLVLNARLTAINLRGEAAKARESSRQAFTDVGAISGTSRVRGFAAGAGPIGQIVGAITGDERGRTNARNLATVVSDLNSGRTTRSDVLEASRKLDFTGTKVTREQFQQAIIDQASAGAKEGIAALIEQSLDDGKLAAGLRRDTKPKKPAKPKSVEARNEFGRDAADQIAGLTAQSDQTPTALVKTNAEVRKLDDLIDDLGRKKPPNFAELIASAEAAKVTVRAGLIDGVAEAFDKPRTLGDQAAAAMRQLDAIAADLQTRKPPSFEALLVDVEKARTAIRDGLTRPFDEFVEAQQQSFQASQLLAQGRVAEANTLREIAQLERQMGPLTADQREAVLATNQALEAQERQVERLHRRQQLYLDALGDVRSIVTQTVFEGPNGIKELPKRLADAFRRFTTEKLVEDLFGDAFDKARDQITGADKVENAADRMADAVAAVASHTSSTTAALDSLAASANGAARAVAEQPSGGAADVQSAAGAFGVTRDAAGRITSDLLDKAPADLGQAAAALDEIVVTAKRQPVQKIDPFASSIGQIATSLGKKVGIDDLKAEKLGQSIGGFASKGLKGAVEGQAAASVAGLLGIKTSSTGASIGGAVGAFLPIPGGSIIGGLAGGIIGNLFGKSVKSGAATIGDATSTANLGGNSKAVQKVASGLAGNVQDSLQQIAEQLGGQLGSFAPVTIGKYGESYKVNTTGASTLKKGKAGVVDFDDDEGAAIAFAVRTAIERGAVVGLSAAVQKAIGSSTDVNKALAEALKVQQLETLLGGVSGQLTAVFKQFDAEATERVRLARQYGLDLLQVEKLNADERADLLDKTLQSRVGSLKDLLANLNYGDLFAGTATERRTAILGEIDDAKADADKGVDGAADRLAELYRQLVTTSQEAFGTAGPELAADRASARAGVERVIQIEEDRVRTAAAQQASTTKAVESVAQLATEGNDMMLTNNDTLAEIRDLLAGANGSYPSANLALVGRELA